jgi:hypothetical protein
MIDRDLIDTLDEAEFTSVTQALASLGRSSVIALMERRLLDRLTLGAFDENDEDLNQRIRVYRRDLGQLRELQALCELYQQDMQS